jgi:hypothetical protein
MRQSVLLDNGARSTAQLDKSGAKLVQDRSDGPKNRWLARHMALCKDVRFTLQALVQAYHRGKSTS